MKRELITGIALLLVSTLCYYVPEYFASAGDVDFSTVPDDFLNHYRFRTSGAFLLTAVYAGFLFFFTNPKLYKIKIIFLWLFLAETYTFVNHVSDEFISADRHDYQEIITTCASFTICFAWFLNRALKSGKSDKFTHGKSYLVKYRPTNISGIFNHLVNLRGHAGIYQDGAIYKFKRDTGNLRKIPIDRKGMESMIKNGRITLEEVDRNEQIGELIGRSYRFLKFNCNHLAKYARQHT